MKQKRKSGPLSGLKVIDLTLFLSGPYGTQILGDLGADVIKVEPTNGDNTRYLPPHFVGDDSAYFASVNRNKFSVALDYKCAEGRVLLERLIGKADVVIDNFKPGVLGKYGIDRKQLQDRYPSLIWCSISGFGQDGPYRERPAYDMVVQALSGGMSMTGEPGGTAVRSGIPIGDIAAGMYAVIGILAAVAERNRTGAGRFIDVAMLDCQVAMLCYQAAYYLASGEVPGLQGRGHVSVPSYRSFTAGDGKDFVICANTERMWQSLCDVIGRPDLKTEKKFADRHARFKNKEEVWVILEAAFLAKSADAWVAAMLAADIPVGTVNTLDRSLNDKQVLHREMVLCMRDANDIELKVAGNPIKFPDGPQDAPRFPPKLGNDTQMILGELLGLTAKEIASLANSQVVSVGKSKRGAAGADA